MFGRKEEVVVDDLNFAQTVATNALSLFHEARSNLESANSILADVIDKANEEITARQARIAEAQKSRRGNEQVITSLTSIVGE